MSFIRILMLSIMSALSLFSYSALAGSIFVYKDAKGSLTFTDAPMREKGYKLISTQQRGSRGRSKWNNKAKNNDPSTQYDSYISYAARSYRLDPSLIKAVIHAESYFNTYARSSAGALGLMQLMPATAGMYHIDNPYNPRQNILAGTKHLSYLLKKYGDNLDFALAAYNAGETSVKRYNGIPPYKETINYVAKVKRLHKQYSLGI